MSSRARNVDRAVAVAGLPGAVGGAYLAALAVLSARPAPTRASDDLNLVVVVPAHDEARGIGATVASLLATDYPPERRRVVVVADNCTDDTAAAAARAGAEVLVRTDAEHRGKGYALELAFATLLGDVWPDAVVVVDADTVVSANLLRSLAGRLAAGEQAVQADYQVRNPETGWRTRLLHIAFTAFHDVRSSGRERLGVSCGLRGNGMAFSRSALALVAHDAHSVVEDLEFGIRLGRAGIRVAYAHEAWVRGEMPSDSTDAASQRDRWEGGRRLLRRSEGPALALDAVRRADPMLADLAADLLVPPLGQLVTALGVGTAAGIVTGRLAGRQRASLVHGAGLLGVVVHVARAWRASGTGAAGLADLARAPGYVAWKLVRRARSVAVGTGAPPSTWVRTNRIGHDLDASATLDQGAA